MTPGPHVILAPGIIHTSILLDPAYNVLATMQLLANREIEQVMPEWIKNVVNELSPQQRHTHQLTMTFVFYYGNRIVDDVQPRCTDFEDFVSHLANYQPTTLRDQIIEGLRRMRPRHLPSDTVSPPPLAAELLKDVNQYTAYVRQLYENQRFFNEDFHQEVHHLLNNPMAMQEMIINDLKIMWGEYVAEEWERVYPLLEGVVDAFSKIDIAGQTLFDAIQTVTGRDLSSIFRFDLSAIEELVLIPSAHTGPYVVPYFGHRRLILVFGARMPEGMRANLPDISRSELLVRLNALADDTRLRILELMTQHEELCAQEIISSLDLSQSAASRHLRQLSATGYLNERRQEGAKCYTLNQSRVDDTLKALSGFLAHK